MKIASWNVNSLKVRLPQVMDWLEAHQPDVIGLQETKLTDEKFPLDTFTEAGWHVCFAGQKTYNGVALASRVPASDVVTSFDGFDDPARRIIGATIGGIRVYNLYVPNGKEVGSDKYHYKLEWLEHMHRQLARELDANEHVAVLGDFNIAPEDRDVHDPEAWAGRILCSEPERAALGHLFELGFEDTFRRFEQAADAFSWWDYRAAGFRRNLGLRIDLVLASSALARACAAAGIDVAPRRLERPSDHAPVYAEFALGSNVPSASAA